MDNRKEAGHIPFPDSDYYALRQFEDPERELEIEEGKLFRDDLSWLLIRRELWLQNKLFSRTLAYCEGETLERASARFPVETCVFCYWYETSSENLLLIDIEKLSREVLKDSLGRIYYDQKGNLAEVLTMPLSSPYGKTILQLQKDGIRKIDERAQRKAEQMLRTFADSYIGIVPLENDKKTFRFFGITPFEEEKEDLGVKKAGEWVKWDENMYLIYAPKEEKNRLAVEVRSLSERLKRRLVFPQVIPAEKVKELLTEEVPWHQLPRIIPVTVQNPVKSSPLLF